MSRQKDRVINIKKVVEYIISHYIFVGICLLCGALGLAGLCYLKNQKLVDTSTNTMTETDLDAMYESLSEEEQIDLSYALYNHERYIEIEKYIEESVFMQIDPYSVKRKTLQYKVELKNSENLMPEEKQALINQLVETYSYYVDEGGLATDIIEGQYLSEDISCESLMEVLFVDYNAESGSYGCVTVGTYVAEIMPELSDAVAECIVKHSKELDVVAKHSLVLVDTYDITERLDWIYTSQRGMYTERISIANRLNDSKISLSANAMSYYNEYVKQEALEANGTEESVGSVEDTTGNKT